MALTPLRTAGPSPVDHSSFDPAKAGKPGPLKDVRGLGEPGECHGWPRNNHEVPGGISKGAGNLPNRSFGNGPGTRLFDQAEKMGARQSVFTGAHTFLDLPVPERRESGTSEGWPKLRILKI